jgi:hypothetical protein
VELSGPNGICDGTVQGKHYFSCQVKHGDFCNVIDVQKKVPPDVSSLFCFFVALFFILSSFFQKITYFYGEFYFSSNKSVIYFKSEFLFYLRKIGYLLVRGNFIFCENKSFIFLKIWLKIKNWLMGKRNKNSIIVFPHNKRTNEQTTVPL